MNEGLHFRAFGLNILSDQPISTLQRAPEAPHDIRITLGPLERSLAPSESKLAKQDWQADGQDFLLSIPSVGRFRVTNGARIQIDPAPDASESDIEAYLLGSAMAALLQQRKLLTLHASAIDTEKGAVLFLGKSGAGKSTLLAAMLARGFAMISDDISAIDFSESGTALVQPAYPTLRLTQATLNVLGERSDNLRAMRADKDKFLKPWETFCEAPRPLYRAFLLTPQDQDKIELKPIASADQFLWLTRFTFRKNYYSGFGLAPFHFNAVSSLARRKLLSQITRPSQSFEIQSLAEQIEQAIT